jgi:DNA-binding NarL/FixJ family response regulator
MASKHTACVGVLIVEDNTTFRVSCEAAIASDSLLKIVASCCSVQQAMSVVKHEPIDVALVDLGLPDGSGIDVIKAIRRRQPDCDVMVMSIFDDEDLVLRAIEAGATGYLLKDSPPHDIVAAIRALRAGGAPISPMIARLLLDRLRSPDPARQAHVAAKWIRFADEGHAPLSESRTHPASDLSTGGSPTAGCALAAGPAAGTLRLSEREIEILHLIARGLSLAEIATLLVISVNTVKTHVKRTYQKLAVSSRTEAIFEAQCMGLLLSTGGLDGEHRGGRAARADHHES